MLVVTINELLDYDIVTFGEHFDWENQEAHCDIQGTLVVTFKVVTIEKHFGCFSWTSSNCDILFEVLCDCDN